MTDTGPSFTLGASHSIYYSLTEEVPGLTEEEKQKLQSVMIKAQEFEAEEANKMRQPNEGQLYKYTNVMKGWQYRWFVLTPETGMLEYYMLEEKKKSRPRGALHLAGAVVTPSDEDNQSFSVSGVCGEVYKLKASDAKDRQFWVDRIRTAVETCSSEDLAPGFAFCKSSSTFHIGEEQSQAAPIHAVSERNIGVLSEKSSEKPQNSMNEIKESVAKAVECQKLLANSIESLPFSGPSIKCSDRRLLLIKATSQATVQSLEQCYLILRRHRQRGVIHSTSPSVVTSCESLDKTKSSVKSGSK